MKKSSLLLLLLWYVTALLAQNNYGPTADKSQIPFDPTQVQGFTKVCVKTAETEIPMEGVSFELQFVTPPSPLFWMEPFTGPDGCAKAFALPSDCTVLPYKTINPDNGITNLDVVLLRDHILGIKSLPSPYKILAADVNGSASIGTSDLVLLSQLNQGEIDTLPLPSWRFVSADYVFPNPQNPFQTPFPPVEPTTPTPSRQFLGIKMGDLDDTADPNNISPGGPSANKTSQPYDPSQLQGPPQDIEAPTVVCLNGLSVNLFQTGLVTLWASDFLQFVDDNVTPVGQIKISLRKSGTGTGFPVDGNGNPLTSIIYNCSQLGLQSVELWAIDEAGNAAYCETMVELQDNFGFCNMNPDTLQVCITYGCNGEPMTGVQVNVSGTAPFQPPFQIDTASGPDGCVAVLLPAPNSTYTISPVKDENPTNGLTTFDLFLIAKHILGTEPLDNPYKMIAADANKSGSITTFDLVELRKLLLGIYAELPNNTSWRFVDGDFMFPNPQNPFSTAFPEFISVQENEQITDVDFVGVKIGDVDCSANIDSLAPPPVDYPDALVAMPDTFLLAGQVYDIPLFMVENGAWSGYQFTLNFDPQKLEYQTLMNHNLASVSNWNLIHAAQGTLTTSWFQMDVPAGFGPGAPIVTLSFRALSTGPLKDMISLDNNGLHPEGYAGWAADKRDLTLTFVSQMSPGPGGDATAEKNTPGKDPAQLQGPPEDHEAPVVNCLNGLSVNIMPIGVINLWASDFLLSVSDNVTPPAQIKLGLRKCGTGTGFPEDAMGNPIQAVTFDCFEQGNECVELWAEDEAGNANYCETQVVIQDNLGNCPGGTNKWNIRVCGAKTTCGSTDGVEEIAYEITTQLPLEPADTAFTFDNNNYCLEMSIPLGSNITIKPIKDDNPLNGVTTYDIVLLMNHIHGIEPLTEPWQWVAADVNRDGLITLEDSAQIRNLILGIYTEYPENTSWRFVLDGYQFPAGDPLSQTIPEFFSVTDMPDTTLTPVFRGIKIGDLNCTAVANTTGEEPEERSPAKDALTTFIGLPSPNPTSGAAQLPVFLPSAENLRLDIMDISGKLIWSNNLYLEKGNHALEIPASALPIAGMYVWRVNTGNLLQTGKIIQN